MVLPCRSSLGFQPAGARYLSGPFAEEEERVFVAEEERVLLPNNGFWLRDPFSGSPILIVMAIFKISINDNDTTNDDIIVSILCQY